MKTSDYGVERAGPFIIEHHGNQVVMHNPMTMEEHAEFTEKWRERVEELRTSTIPQRVAELEELLSKHEALETLAQVAAHNTFQDPETYKEYEQTTEFANVEYLACLLAKRPYDADAPPPTGEHLAEVQRRVEELLRLQTQVFMAPGADTPPSAAEEVQLLTRLFGLVVRGPAYPHHLADTLKGLFQPLAQPMREELGFTVDDALACYEALGEVLNTRLRQRVRELKKSKAEVRRLAKDYRRSGKSQRGNCPPEIAGLARLGDRRLERELRKRARALATADMRAVFCFTPEDLAQLAGIEQERVQAFLDLVVLDFGTVPPEFTEPSATHPLQKRPVLRVGSVLLCPVVEMLIWNLQSIIEAELLNRPMLKERYLRSRARYLENKSLEHVSAIFEHAQVHRRLRYQPVTPGDPPESELDGLVLYDDKLFIIESKSSPRSDPARRGAPRSIEDEVRSVIVEATEQARRAKRYIDAVDIPEFTDERGQVVCIDKQRVQQTFLIVTTLGDFDVYASRMHLLRDMGLLGEGDFAWGVYINDLRIISEHVEFPAEFVHYLRRRLRLNEQKHIVASGELDWFGYYLKQGLVFPDLPDNHLLQLGSFTTAFDDYYFYEMGLRKAKVDKARQPIPKEIRAIIDIMEQEHPEGYSEAVCLLLDWGEDARKKLAHQIREMNRRTLKTGAGHDLSGVSEEGSCGVTYMTAGREGREHFAQKLQAYCAAKKYQMKCDRWLGIGNHVLYSEVANVFVYLGDPWTPDKDLETLVTRLLGGGAG